MILLKIILNNCNRKGLSKTKALPESKPISCPSPTHPLPSTILLFSSLYIQLMEAGVPGAPMDPAVLHVVEEQKSKLDPVTVHSLNMVAKPVQDQLQKVPAVTQIHVMVREYFNYIN